jgi:hypothetical protein
MAKIPIDRQPGDVIYWQDPDPEKWFDLENLSSLTEIDFYITLGNTRGVVDFNGQPFSLKLGIIESLLTRSEISTGSVDNHRAVKKVKFV